MGIGPAGTEFLLFAQRCGVAFNSTAMIGRQYPLVSEAEMALSLRRFGFSHEPGKIKALLATGFAEPFLHLLGAKDIDSFDVDDFESATEIHNFNDPVPSRLHQKYDVVMEQGTLEHVFNYPTALRNCMEMVRVGGHLIIQTPANNWLGHGFYQFCPELFFQALSAENGFEINKVLACRDFRSGSWFEILSPARANHATLGVTYPQNLTIHVLAKRVVAAPIFKTYPQQRHYALGGDTYAVGGDTQKQAWWKRRIVASRNRLPLPVLDLLRAMRGLTSFGHSAFVRAQWPQ